MADDLDTLLGRALVHSTPHAIVAVNLDHEIQFYNPAAATIFGFAADEVLGQPLDILIPEGVQESHHRRVADFASGPDRVQSMGERGEIQGRRADGSTFPAEATIIKLTRGAQTLLVAIVNDISGRKALEEERRRLAEILEATPDFVGVADAEGRAFFHNRGARRLLGLAEDAPMEGWRVADSHPPRLAERIRDEALPAAREDGWWEGESVLLTAEGEEVPISQMILAHRDRQGEVGYFSTIARDLRPYQRAQDELRKLSRALTQIADMVWITDLRGVVEYVNPAFEAATGFSAEEAEGRQVSELLQSGYHDQAFYARLWEELEQRQTFRDVFVNQTRNGATVYIDETISPVANDGGEWTHFVATGRDVTERFRMEERLRHLAFYDPVTELPNRAHFEDRLGQAMARAERQGQKLAVIFLDLDRFKNVNDTLGHHAGDEVLQQVAERLSRRLRKGDLLARLGGDEFAFLLEPVQGSLGATRAADRILVAMEDPFQVEGQTFGIHASMGIALYPEGGEDPATLIQQADTAMFEAKRGGGSQYRLFSETLSRSSAQRFHFEKELRRAVEQETIAVFYQPILALPGHRLVGAEALARCRMGEQGWVEPRQFIPVAEETGLIHPLGEAILAQACRQAQRWRAEGYPLERIALNLSPVQLEAPDFPDRVARILGETGLPANRLELELTEETLLRGEEGVMHRLGELRDMGVRIALDDFGTGFAAPASLKHLPVHRLKLDRSFISGIDQDPANQTIFRSLLVLAEGFGFRVTAEGVETPAEEAYLAGTSCQEVQGFLYGPPCPADDFLAGPLSRFAPVTGTEGF